MAIDPVKESKNWYVQNKRIKGNWKLFIISSVIIGTICAIIFVIFELIYINETVNDVFFGISGVIFGIVAIFLVYKLGFATELDGLGIKQELLLWIFISPIGILITFIAIIIAQESNVSQSVETFIRDVFPVCLYHIGLYLAVIFPKQLFTRESTSNVNSNSGDVNDSAMIRSVSWRQVVSVYEGFEALMNHLAKEFSMECLLFIQEVEW